MPRRDLLEPCPTQSQVWPATRPRAEQGPHLLPTSWQTDVFSAHGDFDIDSLINYFRIIFRNWKVQLPSGHWAAAGRSPHADDFGWRMPCPTKHGHGSTIGRLGTRVPYHSHHPQKQKWKKSPWNGLPPCSIHSPNPPTIPNPQPPSPGHGSGHLDPHGEDGPGVKAFRLQRQRSCLTQGMPHVSWLRLLVDPAGHGCNMGNMWVCLKIVDIKKWHWW